MIYCTRKVPKSFYGSHNTVKLRSLKNYDKEVFIEKLKNVNWFSVINCENVDEAWCKFYESLMLVIDSIAPIKEVRIKQRSEDWVNNSIIDSIHRRDVAYNFFCKSILKCDHIEYCKLRNSIIKL